MVTSTATGPRVDPSGAAARGAGRVPSSVPPAPAEGGGWRRLVVGVRWLRRRRPCTGAAGIGKGRHFRRRRHRRSGGGGGDGGRRRQQRQRRQRRRDASVSAPARDTAGRRRQPRGPRRHRRRGASPFAAPKTVTFKFKWGGGAALVTIASVLDAGWTHKGGVQNLARSAMVQGRTHPSRLAESNCPPWRRPACHGVIRCREYYDDSSSSFVDVSGSSISGTETSGWQESSSFTSVTASKWRVYISSYYHNWQLYVCEVQVS